NSTPSFRAQREIPLPLCSGRAIARLFVLARYRFSFSRHSFTLSLEGPLVYPERSRRVTRHCSSQPMVGLVAEGLPLIPPFVVGQAPGRPFLLSLAATCQLSRLKVSSPHSSAGTWPLHIVLLEVFALV